MILVWAEVVEVMVTLSYPFLAYLRRAIILTILFISQKCIYTNDFL